MATQTIGDERAFEDFAAGVLKAICDCLENNTRLGAPDSVFPYHTTPPADCCDFLAVSIEGLFPYAIGKFPEVLNEIESCEDIGMGVDWAIHLLRPCWPMAKAHPTTPFPSMKESAEAATLMYEDARVMTCCLLDHFEYLEEAHGVCNAIVPGLMRPYPPDGGCAGWRWDIKVEFDRGCYE